MRKRENEGEQSVGATGSVTKRIGGGRSGRRKGIANSKKRKTGEMPPIRPCKLARLEMSGARGLGGRGRRGPTGRLEGKRGGEIRS